MELGPLEETLGYRFVDPGTLWTAVTHRSFANENPDAGVVDNEKLEFLGDAVLDLVIGHLLMQRHPTLREGELSTTRATLVSEVALAEVAHDLGLGAHLRLGRGEERSGGRDKPSLLSDAVEAVIAAVYLDGGFEAAWQVIERLFAGRLGAVGQRASRDHKTILQERVQARHGQTPAYQLVDERGPDHAKIFVAAVSVGGQVWARAEGRSKKEAEQRAAALAVAQLDETDDAD